MKAKALAICAGLGLALAGCYERAPGEYPIMDQGVYDAQGGRKVPGIGDSPDIKVPSAPNPKREAHPRRQPRLIDKNETPQGWERFMPRGSLDSPPTRGLVLPARVALDPEQKHVRGKVRYVGPRTVKIEDEDARWYELELTGDTRVTRNGQNASALTFVDGAMLDATYRISNGTMVLTDAEVIAVPK